MRDQSEVQTFEDSADNDSVLLASIVIDHRYQVRTAMDEGVIADYEEAIRKQERWPFPPVKLVSQYLVDGFHRVEAAKRALKNSTASPKLRASLRAIPCERVRVDIARDDVVDTAMRHALAANHNHGLPRSRADKRRCVELALKQWPDESDREIAKLTGTTHPFVAKIRQSLEVETLPPLPQADRPSAMPEVETLPSRPATESSSATLQVETLPPQSDSETVPPQRQPVVASEDAALPPPASRQSKEATPKQKRECWGKALEALKEVAKQFRQCRRFHAIDEREFENVIKHLYLAEEGLASWENRYCKGEKRDGGHG